MERSRSIRPATVFTSVQMHRICTKKHVKPTTSDASCTYETPCLTQTTRMHARTRTPQVQTPVIPLFRLQKSLEFSRAADSPAKFASISFAGGDAPLHGDILERGIAGNVAALRTESRNSNLRALADDTPSVGLLLVVPGSMSASKMRGIRAKTECRICYSPYPRDLLVVLLASGSLRRESQLT